MSDGIAATQAGAPSPAEHDFDRALLSIHNFGTTPSSKLNSARPKPTKASRAPCRGLPRRPVLRQTQMASHSNYLTTPKRPPWLHATRSSERVLPSLLADDMIGTQVAHRPEGCLDVGAGWPSCRSPTATSPMRPATTRPYPLHAADCGRNQEQRTPIAGLHLPWSVRRAARPPFAFRRDIVNAVDLDTQDVNAIGREVAAGLYTPGPP